MKKLFLLSLILSISSAPCIAIAKTFNPDTIPFSHILEINPGDSRETIISKAAHVIPNPRQVKGLENEFIAFIHFGPNTFTGREWGTGHEDPTLFNPTNVDTEQWVSVLKDSGIKMIILTVKHHDGYVIWQSRYTNHGIMQSPYKHGEGDVLKDLAEACKKYGMKLGIYLSPADLYQIESPEGLYGNGSEKKLRTIPREVEEKPFKNKTTFQFKVDDYNEYFLNQLFEVLTEYGPVHEVWFDGANPKEKGGQTYDYNAWLEVVNTLAPEAVVFGAGDVRWCGNEAGYTRETEWNVIPFKNTPENPQKVSPDKSEDIGSEAKLGEGDFLKYVYAETDTSIRDGWFYRDDDKQSVRSPDDVYDIWERAVGGNSVLLLNVPPNKEGRFSDRDVATLLETGKRIRKTYGINLLENSSAPSELLDNDPNTGINFTNEIIITTPSPIRFNRLVLQEGVAVRGERIASVALDAKQNGQWIKIAKATNVGNKRIIRFPEITSDSIRLRLLDSRLTPLLSSVSAHYYHSRPPLLSITRNRNGMVNIEPRKSDFKWKKALTDASKNLSQGTIIHYTTNGTEPNSSSPVFTSPFPLKDKGVVKAVAVIANEIGSPTVANFGYFKGNWKPITNDIKETLNDYHSAFDDDPSTYWIGSNRDILTIDMGERLFINGFTYTPPANFSEGMIEKGYIEISNNGKKWKKLGEFEFGNLINDPSPRSFYFPKGSNARYVRVHPVSISAGGTQAAIAEIDIF